MGELVLEAVMQILDAKGFLVERGYPQGWVQSITEPVCAVNLESTDLDSMEATVLVQVISPAQLGAQVCQEKAQEVGMALSDQGYGCTISACSFDGRTGMFMAQIRAVSLVKAPNLAVNGIKIQYAKGFKSWRSLDDSKTDWTNAKWHFELEEFIPIGMAEGEISESSFNLIHIYEGETETITNATWTSRSRIWEPTGIRQTRTGVAQSRTVS